MFGLDSDGIAIYGYVIDVYLYNIGNRSVVGNIGDKDEIVVAVRERLIERVVARCGTLSLRCKYVVGNLTVGRVDETQVLDVGCSGAGVSEVEACGFERIDGA